MARKPPHRDQHEEDPKHALKMVFGRSLYRAMVAKGLNQSELGRRVGIQRDSISYYINGKNLPGPENMKKLCKALDVTLDQLIPASSIHPLMMASDAPDIEVKSRPDGKVWISLNKALNFRTVNEIMKLIDADDPSVKH